MAELSGSRPNAWHAEAEELAGDAGCGDAGLAWPSLPELDRVVEVRQPVASQYLKMLRDRQQVSREQSERLAVLERERPRFLGAGVVADEGSVR